MAPLGWTKPPLNGLRAQCGDSLGVLFSPPPSTLLGGDTPLFLRYFRRFIGRNFPEARWASGVPRTCK
eukprot:1257183-Prymnesium_polylepis.2